MGNYCITGSASGIGRATRHQLEAAGHRVIGVDLRDAEITADFSTAAGRAAAVEGVLAASGGVLDGLVPCAGVSGAAPELVVSINYFGALAVVEGLRDALAAGTAPSVVLISSNSTTSTPGITEDMIEVFREGEDAARALFAPRMSHHAYATGKLALARWMRRASSAPEWAGAGIRLNAVAPGVTVTNMTKELIENPQLRPLLDGIPIPAGRFAEPEEVAELICFLLSPKAGYIWGQTIFVDGGTDAVVQPTGYPRPL